MCHSVYSEQDLKNLTFQFYSHGPLVGACSATKYQELGWKNNSSNRAHVRSWVHSPQGKSKQTNRNKTKQKNQPHIKIKIKWKLFKKVRLTYITELASQGIYLVHAGERTFGRDD
jgi:hypothetical protein